VHIEKMLETAIYFVIQSKTMKTMPRFLAALELLLVFPAVLFLTSLVVRSIQPQQFEPAHTAQRIVDWFASSTPIGLWLLLIALPLSVLIIGSATLLRDWRRDPELRDAALKGLTIVRNHFATALIACTTATAFAILCVVAFHMATD
jgi:ABC-type Fe3+ transport system permease subunit